MNSRLQKTIVVVLSLGTNTQTQAVSISDCVKRHLSLYCPLFVSGGLEVTQCNSILQMQRLGIKIQNIVLKIVMISYENICVRYICAFIFIILIRMYMFSSC